MILPAVTHECEMWREECLKNEAVTRIGYLDPKKDEVCEQFWINIQNCPPTS
jgi:hypothetical protein